MRFEDLTSDQKNKALACKTSEELVSLAKAEGYELSDEDLDNMSGGAWGGSNNSCPNCGAQNWHTEHTGTVNQVKVCNQCGCKFD